MTQLTTKNHYLQQISRDEGVQRSLAAVAIALVVAATKSFIFNKAS